MTIGPSNEAKSYHDVRHHVSIYNRKEALLWEKAKK